VELPAATTRLAGRVLPVAGGGYHRLLPLPLIRWSASRFMAAKQVFRSLFMTCLVPVWMVVAPSSVVGAGSTIEPDLSPQAIVHVAVDGLDTNDGFRDPVATLERALAIVVGSSGDASEIVIHGGTYQLSQPIVIAPRPDRPERRLIIRAAAGEKPVFDGGQGVRLVPMPGEAGVGMVSGDFRIEDVPQIWDAARRVRYRVVSGIDTLRGTDDGVAILSPTMLAIRPKGGQFTDWVELRMAMPEYGLEITRDHVTIDGLSFTGFGKSHESAAIAVGFRAESQGRTDDILIENCHVENSYSGFFIRRGTHRVGIRSCVVRDVASGVNQWGGEAVVEDCDIRNDDFGASPFAFKNSDPMTGNFGIWAYRGSTAGHYRGNTIKGFRYGIAIKTGTPDPNASGTASFVIEENTLIDDADVRSGILGESSWGVMFVGYQRYGKRAIMRRNVIDGFSIPLPQDSPSSGVPVEDLPTVDENLIWLVRGLAAMNDSIKFFSEQRMGSGNLATEPLFANPKSGDYRLLPGSPAVSAGWRQASDRRQVWQPGDPYLPSLRVEVPSISAKQGWLQGHVMTSTPKLRVKLAGYGLGALQLTRVKILSEGQELSSETHEFRNEEVIQLPELKGTYVASIAVMDGMGVWSDGRDLPIQNGIPVLGFDRVITVTNRDGFVVFNPDNLGFPQSIRYRKKGSSDWVEGFDTGKTYSAASDGTMRNLGAQPLFVNPVESGTTYEFQIVVRSSATGQVREYTASPVLTATAIGEPFVYHVSPQGLDQPGRGARSEPLQTLQYALDRSLPGDTIRLLPGVYHGAVVMVHHGTRAHPIKIEAEQPGTVILTGDKETGTVLLLLGAAHVKVSGLNIQWAKRSGLVCEKCDSVEITGNYLINTRLGAHDQMGQGIRISDSRDTWVHHNVIHGWWSGLGLTRAPGTMIVNNTILDTALTGIAIGSGSQGSKITFNSINFTGNHALEFAAQDLNYSDFVIDYNNYGTTFQSAKRILADPDTVFPRAYPFLRDSREFIYSYSPLPELGKSVLHSFAEWKKASGHDKHSIFADPLWVDPLVGRFDVRAGSQNLLPDGHFIGAKGVSSLP